MADAKEDRKVVTQEASGEVKTPGEASSSKNTPDSEDESPPVPPKLFEEDQHEAKDRSDKDGKDGTAALPKSSDGLDGGQGDTTTSSDVSSSGEAKEHKESSVKENVVEKKDNKVDKEEVKKEPPAESASGDSKDPASSTEKEAAPKPEKVVQSTADETTIPKKATEVIMRDKNPSPQINGQNGKDPRVSMDDCIQEVKKTGRGSLQMSESPFDGIKFTTHKTAQLETVLEKLSYVEGRVGKVDDRYIVPRDGVTSFVFLAKK